MKVVVPLFGKMVGLFLLNVAILSGILAWALYQGWGMKAIPVYRSEKLEHVGTALLRQLEAVPLSDWDKLLEKASQEHGVQFLLYSTDGPRLAGPNLFIPANVHLEVTGQLGPAPGWEDFPPGSAPPKPVFLPDDARPIFAASTGYWCFLKGYIQHAEGSGKVALITQSDSPTGNGLYASTHGIFWVIGGALAVSALLWLPFVRSFTSRLHNMQNTARKLATGDFTARANQRGKDELAALGHSVNYMADQIGTLVEGQKRLLGDIAHELSAPVARMQAILGILSLESSGKRERYVERLGLELEQMGVLVQELLSLSKASLKRCVELRPLLLRQQLQRVIDREKQDGENVLLDVPEDEVVLSDPELLCRAVGNVLRNAIRYAGKAGPIVISSQSEKENTIISITDHGPGVAEEALPLLFEAFYRPDVSRSREAGGSGLGLAIVKSCVEATQGTVSARNGLHGGLTVEITQTRA